jgi:uncharacterized protein (TIRG00374 family)
LSGGRLLKSVLLLVKIAFSVGLFVWLLRKFNVHEALLEARHADPRWLGAAVGVFVLSNLMGSWLWGRLLKMQDVDISFPRLAAYYFVGLFFNNFLPANIAGDFARISAAKEHTNRSAAVFSATVMDRLLGSLAVAALGLAGAVLSWRELHDLRVVLLVAGLFTLSLLMYLAIFRRGALAWIEWPFRALGLRRMEEGIAHLMDELHAYEGRGAELFRLLLFGVLIQVTRVSMHVCVARGLGLTVPASAIFVLVPILASIVMLPISLNGIGIREGAAVVLFRPVGLSGGQAFSFQFLTWVLSVLVSLVGGLLFILRAPLRAAAKLERSPESS